MHRRHAIFAIILLLLATPAANCQDAVKVGDRIGKLEFTDIRSLPRTLDDLGAKKAFVLVFTNASCPLAERYLPTLKALEKEYRAKEVQFVAVNAAEEDSIVAMATQSVRHEVEFPFVKDFGGLWLVHWVCAARPRRSFSTGRNASAIVGGSTINTVSPAFARNRRAAICKRPSTRCSRGERSSIPRPRWTAARSLSPKNANPGKSPMPRRSPHCCKKTAASAIAPAGPPRFPSPATNRPRHGGKC